MKNLFLITILVLTFGFSSLAVSAATYTVTRNDDRNEVCAPIDCSLREAVAAANSDASNDTIIFAEDLSLITLTNEIIIENAGALSINGRGANVLTIDGGAGENRIFSIDNATVNLSSVTLTGGGGRGSGTIYTDSGGAISVSGGSLNLDRVFVTGNSSPVTRGGGINFSSGAHLITNSTIFGNTARECGGFSISVGTLTVINSTISGNTARSGGGGFCNSPASKTALRNVTITNNKAGSGNSAGGGIFQLEASGAGSTLNLGNTAVTGNLNAEGASSDFWINSGLFTSEGGNLFGNLAGA